MIKYVKPCLFIFVIILHIAIFVSFNFVKKEKKQVVIDTFQMIDFNDNTEEPQAEPDNTPVKAEKQVFTEAEKVIIQKDDSQNTKETESTGGTGGTGGTVESTDGEIEYLPQYKLIKAPVMPVNEIQSKIIYPPLANKQGIEAIVIVELYIDQNGSIKKISILKDPGYGFAEAAINALKGIKCIPGEAANGVKAASIFRYPVRFTLK
jgi:periplasmic protein TonB